MEFSHRPLPGQFIHVLCGDGVFLRRPISICDYNEGILRFSFAVRGEGTKRLANHNEGDMLDILGRWDAALIRARAEREPPLW